MIEICDWLVGLRLDFSQLIVDISRNHFIFFLYRKDHAVAQAQKIFAWLQLSSSTLALSSRVMFT